MRAPLVVNEIFTSIQGESSRAGLPCTFVRLTGCHLRCSYCDTAYAFHEGHPLGLEEIVEEVARRGIPSVTVTGGEPLLQEGVHELIRLLLDRGFEVQVETSGSVETEGVDSRARIILDVKTPGSGESGRMLWSTVERLRPVDEVKFVIVDRADYEYARELIGSGKVPAGVGILISPATGSLRPDEVAEWMLEDKLRARLQLQLHKIIWGDHVRGV